MAIINIECLYKGFFERHKILTYVREMEAKGQKWGNLVNRCEHGKLRQQLAVFLYYEIKIISSNLILASWDLGPFTPPTERCEAYETVKNEYILMSCKGR